MQLNNTLACLTAIHKHVNPTVHYMSVMIQIVMITSSNKRAIIRLLLRNNSNSKKQHQDEVQAPFE